MIDKSNLCTVIIPHRGVTSDRSENLELVIEHYRAILPESTILVIEQEFVQKTFINNTYVKVIFAYNPNGFSRSWGMNVGAVCSKTPVILGVDNDVILEERGILDGLNLIIENKIKFCTPYGDFFDLNNDARLIYKDKRIFDFSKIRSRYIIDEPCKFGGALMANRDEFISIGGMDEEFRKWGGEDEAFIFKVRTLSEYKKFIEPKLFHLYHEKNIDATPENDLYSNNYKLWSLYKNLDGKKEAMAEFIQDRKLYIGKIDKYKNEI